MRTDTVLEIHRISQIHGSDERQVAHQESTENSLRNHGSFGDRECVDERVVILDGSVSIFYFERTTNVGLLTFRKKMFFLFFFNIFF